MYSSGVNLFSTPNPSYGLHLVASEVFLPIKEFFVVVVAFSILVLVVTFIIRIVDTGIVDIGIVDTGILLFLLLITQYTSNDSKLN